MKKENRKQKLKTENLSEKTAVRQKQGTEKQLSAHDTTSRMLEAHNDVFADIVNVLLFNGKRIVKEDELEDAVVHSSINLDNRTGAQERDVAKYWKGGAIRICLFGFENQTQVDKDMPLRIMGYDGASYKQQLLDKKKNGRYPVVTLVLYFGLRRWQKPKSLFDCFDVPKELAPFIHDYKINVFDIAHLPDKQYDMFTSDFKVVADYYMQIRKNKRYKPSSFELRHVHDVLQMLKELTKNEEFENIQEKAEMIKTKKGRVTMYNVIGKMLAESEAKGMAKGLAKGEARGIAKERHRISTSAARKLIARNMPAKDIADITGLKLSEVKKLMAE